MAARKQAPRPRSGFVTEEQRHTKRVSLRLDPAVVEELQWFAGEREWTLSQTVTRALGALRREEDKRTLGACADIIAALPRRR